MAKFDDSSIANHEEMSYLSFIANAGGLTGLFLGLSFISIFEVLYFAIEPILSKLSERYTKNVVSLA